MELKICHMYPDVLNLYGDRGNIMCMEKRLAWRHIEVKTTRFPLGVSASLAGFDLVFIGGGQSFEQQLLLDDLRSGKAAEIRSAINDGVTFLAIDGGFQMLGEYIESADKRRCEFINAIDMRTESTPGRITGNYKFLCTDSCGGSLVVGFENRSGKTRLGKGIEPLGRVLVGNGNNGEDGTEGVHYKNVFGTYSHGPVLPKNPELCDFILRTALERKYGKAELPPLDDSAELFAHDQMNARIK